MRVRRGKTLTFFSACACLVWRVSRVHLGAGLHAPGFSPLSRPVTPPLAPSPLLPLPPTLAAWCARVKKMAVAQEEVKRTWTEARRDVTRCVELLSASVEAKQRHVQVVHSPAPVGLGSESNLNEDGGTALGCASCCLPVCMPVCVGAWV